MNRSVGKIFIAAAVGVALALSGTALLSGNHSVRDQSAQAQTDSRQLAAAPAQQASEQGQSSQTAQEAAPQAGVPDEARLSGFEQGYRAGYQDAQRDCSVSARTAPTTYARRRVSSPRVRVAGTRYYAEPSRGHSTRNMILRIAAPAAIGAGIGAIAGGGRGAGAGALIGGGAGALYHLIKHK
jgi:hypothetical protein